MAEIKVAGVSVLNGDMKVRFASNMAYVKGLTKGGNSNIQLVELPEAMSKGDAVKYLMTLPEFTTDPEVVSTLVDANEKYNLVQVTKAGNRDKPKKEAKKPKKVPAKVEDLIA